MFVWGLTQSGLPGKDYSELLVDVLAEGLARKFPCTGVLTGNDIRSLLGLAREQLLLGTPDEDQVSLQSISDRLGGTGVLVFGSFGKSGNNYFVNIKTANMHTARVISNQMFTATGDDDSVLLDLIQTAAAQSQSTPCRPKWTGSITVRDTMDDFLVRKIGTTTKMTMGLTRDLMTVELKNILVTDPDTAVATISRGLEHKFVNYELREGTSNCAAQGWGTIRDKKEEEWIIDRHETMLRSSYGGQWSADLIVRITVGGDGRYRISWDPPKVDKDEETYDSTTSSPDVCGGAQFETVEKRTPSKSALSWPVTFVEGKVDPSNVDRLSGFSEASTPYFTGRPEDGQTGTETVSRQWSLTRSR